LIYISIGEDEVLMEKIAIRILEESDTYDLFKFELENRNFFLKKWALQEMIIITNLRVLQQ
jgi:hypothetical protein